MNGRVLRFAANTPGRRGAPDSSPAGSTDRNGAPRPLRILIADDDPDTVLTLTTLLEHVGHEVRGVYSGRDVMGGVTDFDPDVVVLDINLPARSGWDLAEGIRQQCGRKRPKLIGISGEYKHDADQVLSQTLGFDHYLLKPHEPAELIRLIEPPSYSGPA